MVIGYQSLRIIRRFLQKIKCSLNFINKKHSVWHRQYDKENRYLQLDQYKRIQRSLQSQKQLTSFIRVQWSLLIFQNWNSEIVGNNWTKSIA